MVLLLLIVCVVNQLLYDIICDIDDFNFSDNSSLSLYLNEQIKILSENNIGCELNNQLMSKKIDKSSIEEIQNYFSDKSYEKKVYIALLTILKILFEDIKVSSELDEKTIHYKANVLNELDFNN